MYANHFEKLRLDLKEDYHLTKVDLQEFNNFVIHIWGSVELIVFLEEKWYKGNRREILGSLLWKCLQQYPRETFLCSTSVVALTVNLKMKYHNV